MGQKFTTLDLEMFSWIWQRRHRQTKLDFTENLKFCASKDTIHRVKRQPKEWEKIFANYISDKGLIFIIYREHLELNKKTINSKSAKDLNKHFSKEYIQMANNSMKRCSTSLIFREMQIKITMWYHLTSIRRLLLKTNKQTNKPTGSSLVA